MAATGAGMKCLVTVNDYSKNEAYSEAKLVVSCLGDKTEQATVLSGKQRQDVTIEGVVTVPLLQKIVE
jgi:hypothetical protein